MYYQLDDALKEIKQGYIRSIQIHGDWQDYTPKRVILTVLGEVWELLWATIRVDRDGPHGIVNEMRDVAIVSMKALLWYRRRIEAI